jgi:uncharacterized protein
MSVDRLTRDQARRVLVAAQSLDVRSRRKPTKRSVLEVIRRMGALQIDTIHVVARSPYLVLWSRLGDYQPEWLDELLAERRIFEYWSHEASFLPIEDYALYRHRMIDPGDMGWKYSHEWMAKNGDTVQRVLREVRDRGPVRSADFERRDGKGGGWWGWKPEKRALELLLTAGELMIVRRERFQRVYDLRERALPEWDDGRLTSAEEAHETLVLKAAAALGVATERWLADYFRMSRRHTAVAVKSLVAKKALRQVAIEGITDPAWVDATNEERVERAAAGKVRASLTTVLSPFDPLVWDRARALALFDFEYRLECYTPRPKRRYGYYVLPILHRGRLVGRLDAKAHRKSGAFEVISLYVEEGVKAGEAMLADIARALVETATWHGTPAVRVRRTRPAGLARSLRRAIEST